jgi:hypothetical protein
MNFFKSSVTSVAHFIARQFTTLGKGLKFAEAHQNAVKQALVDVVSAVEAGEVLTGHAELLAVTEAAKAAGLALLGKAFEVIHTTNAAADAKFVNLPLDQQTVQGLKDLFATAEKTIPGITAAPAGLPIETAAK